jgi:hypothetical protein
MKFKRIFTSCLAVFLLCAPLASCAKENTLPPPTTDTPAVGEKIQESLQKYHSRLKNQKLVSFVDYSASIKERRFFVYDLKERQVIYSTHVGHSGYSGTDKPTHTSNTPNTRKTSLGLFKIGAQYYGRFGKSKRLHGLSDSNSNAFKRAIVAHSMPGHSPEDLYSWGCFTFFEEDLDVAFGYMRKGTYLLAVD